MSMSEAARLLRRPRRIALTAVLGLSLGCDVPTALPRFENTLALPAPDLEVPVLGVPTAATVSVDLADVDATFADRVRGGELAFTPVNPGDVTGSLEITITEPASGAAVTGTIDVAAGGTPQVIVVPEQTMRAFLGHTVEITARGALGPVTLPNPETLRVATLVRITFEIGGEG